MDRAPVDNYFWRNGLEDTPDGFHSELVRLTLEKPNSTAMSDLTCMLSSDLNAHTVRVNMDVISKDPRKNIAFKNIKRIFKDKSSRELPWDETMAKLQPLVFRIVDFPNTLKSRWEEQLRTKGFQEFNGTWKFPNVQQTEWRSCTLRSLARNQKKTIPMELMTSLTKTIVAKCQPYFSFPSMHRKQNRWDLQPTNPTTNDPNSKSSLSETITGKRQCHESSPPVQPKRHCPNEKTSLQRKHPASVEIFGITAFSQSNGINRNMSRKVEGILRRNPKPTSRNVTFHSHCSVRLIRWTQSDPSSEQHVTKGNKGVIHIHDSDDDGDLSPASHRCGLGSASAKVASEVIIIDDSSSDEDRSCKVIPIGASLKTVGLDNEMDDTKTDIVASAGFPSTINACDGTQNHFDIFDNQTNGHVYGRNSQQRHQHGTMSSSAVAEFPQLFGSCSYLCRCFGSMP